MTEAFIFFTVMAAAAVFAIVWEKLARRGECKHKWTKWADPVSGEGYPYQLRSCSECNVHQSRLVRGEKS